MGGFLDNFLKDKPDWLKMAILQEEYEQEEENIKEKEEQMKKNQKQD